MPMQASLSPSTMSKSRRFTAGSWAVLAVALAFAALTGTFIWMQVTGPFDGAMLKSLASAGESSGVRVVPLRERAEGLRAGDLLLAIEGRTVESWAEDLVSRPAPSPDWKIGETLGRSPFGRSLRACPERSRRGVPQI